ncbi:hypothetical protein GRC12_33670, partial [Streptomyces griseorubiginosus]|nr:hypothetical protein [Streptomyces griseorubiginosus]
QHRDRQQRLQHRPLLVRKIPSPHIQIITARDEEGSRLSKHALARLVVSAAEHLHSGADVSYGFYLERPSYLSLAVVTCSPNRALPGAACPVA